MKLKGILQAICLFALFAAAPAVHADALAAYPFVLTLASTDVDLASAASAIAVGTGLTDSTRFAALDGNPLPSFRVGADETDGTSFATAISSADVFGFSVTPNAGQFLTLSTLTLDLAVNNATVTTNVRVELGASANGPFITAGVLTGFNSTTFTPETVPLAAANATLAAGIPVFVRFVVYDNSTSTDFATEFDNITLNGTVAPIPEPGTNVLLVAGALGVAGIVAWRRRVWIAA